MIYLYDGTPGSGKSYHAVLDVLRKLDKRRYNKVIANFDLETDSDNFFRWKNSDFSVESLVDFCYEHHDPNLGESQTLVVIDEASTFFNARDWNAARKTTESSRSEWVQFFAEHRKYRYNIILITQSDIMIDKQIRKMIETQVSHYAVNHFLCLPIKIFMCVERWYNQRKKIGQSFIRFKKRIARRYDTFAIFSKDARKFKQAQTVDASATAVHPPEAPLAHLEVDAISSVDLNSDSTVEASIFPLERYFGKNVNVLDD